MGAQTEREVSSSGDACRSTVDAAAKLLTISARLGGVTIAAMSDPFSSAARKAAVLARTKVAAERKAATIRAEPALFVVRSTAGPTFRWELRRHGAVVLTRSATQFASYGEALAAGQAELDRIGAQPA